MIQKTANSFIYMVPSDSGSEEFQVKISYLLNGIYWFIENVFIIQDENSCRLVSIHLNKLLFHKSYKNAKNARIAFTRLYKNKIWKKEIKPYWSPFYPTNPEWLNQKFSNLKR
jgi:hypothetical protein